MKQHFKLKIVLLLLCLGLMGSLTATSSAQPAEPIINEFSIDIVGTDIEFVEIFGAPNTDYSNYRILEIEGDNGGTQRGLVDEIIPVGITNANGYWTAGLDANDLENGTVTLLLVKNATPNLVMPLDLDTNDDSILDSAPWEAIVDSVAIFDNGTGDATYSNVVLAPNFDGSSFKPGGASRIPNGVDTNTAADWMRNDFDGAGFAGFTGTPAVGEALNTPNAVNQAVGRTLVINEIDYDQPGTDTAEFVEIKNVGTLPVNLNNVTLRLIDATVPPPASYNMLDLPDVNLAAGDYYVVCANAATVPNCDLDSTPDTNFIQNGAPDVVELLVDNVRVDVVSYERSAVGFVEGSGEGLEDNSTIASLGISRFPDGFDSDSNNTDFSPRCITPGAANSANDSNCGGVVAPTITKIHTIQGSGTTVTTTSQVTVEAIVIGDYQRDNEPQPVAGGGAQLQGFFIQEEDADVDANPATSEGIFVFCQDCPTNVAVGDKVEVTGNPGEFFNMSQIVATTADSITVISSDNPLPTPTNLTLPAAIGAQLTLNDAIAALTLYYEPYEGMLVKFTDTLTVAEHFQLARYGQIVLTQGARPRQFTDVNAPNADGNTQHQINVLSRSIILDDDDNRQNSPLEDDVEIYHPRNGLSTTNYFRAGDTISNLTGVLHWSFAGQSGTDAWRIRPVPEKFQYQFTPANPRPTTVADVGGNFTVAAFNVLNYFTTIDTTSSNNTGTCAPSGTLDCRGADSAAELQRQQDKLVAAICEINADVFGVIEIENNATDSLTALKNALNAVNGCGPYEFINSGTIGTDAIKVGLLYKPAVVNPVGNFAILNSAVDPNFVDTLNRPALAQTFQLLPAGDKITVVVNHLKSKGSECGAGDDDLTMGQGNCAETRRQAAEAEVAWLATDPTGQGTTDILVIGDLNAYRKESAIQEFTDAGYVDLINQFVGPDAYSFLFGGQLGYLDHALASPSLAAKATGAAEFHINADEIALFDYNDDIKDTGEATFEEEPDALSLNETGFYRSSDHDPLVVGFNLTATSGAKITIVKDAQPNDATDFEFVVYNIANNQSSIFSEFALDDDGNAGNDLSNEKDLSVPAGLYAIAEKPNAAWDVTIECRSDNTGRTFELTTDGNTQGEAVVFDINDNEAVTCRFVNKKLTSITIKKEVVYVADLDTDSERNFIFGGDFGQFELDDPLAADDNDGITDTKVFSDLAAGVYEVHESANGNWIQTVTCEGDTDNGSVFDNVGAGVEIDLDAGENIVCTFKNVRVTYELTYKKVLEDAPALDSNWTFTLQPQGEAVINPFATIPGAGGTGISFTLPVDAYTVGEVVPPGYDLKKINCGDGGVSVDFPANDNFFIILQQDTTCTFTNVAAQTTTITIKKDVEYVADLDTDSERNFIFGGDFGQFELDDPQNGDDADGVTDTKVFSDLAAGVYEVHESANGNWIQTVTCEGDTDNGSVFDNVGAGVEIDLDAGENIVCTFKNVRVTYELTYKKVLEDAPVPGSDWVFTLQPDGESVINPFTTAPAAGGSSATYTLPVDAYTVGEVVPVGYDLKKIICDDGGTSVDFPASDSFYIILQQDMTCTFTNVATASDTGSIRVTKDIIGNGTGQFTICVNADCRLFNGDGAQDTWVNLTPGQYTISEQDAGADWNEPAPQQVDVAAGQQVEVTVTNTYTSQTICNGLDPLAHLSAVIAPTGNPNEYQATITNTSVCLYDVGFAAYEKPDNNNANQILFSSDTKLQIPQGDTVLTIQVPTCAAQLDVFFDPSHLGVYDTYAGQQANLDLAPLVLPAFATNLYGPFGNWYGPRLLAFKHVGVDFCGGVIVTREITIQKVSGDPGYDAPVNFSGDLGDFNTNGNGGLYTFQDLAPGVYNVSEIVPNGWTLTSVTCNQQPMTINNNTVAIDVTNGDATCTFTNAFVPPVTREITIQKVSGDPGYDAPVNFSGDLGDFNTNGNGGLYTFQDLAPGVYNVSEIVPTDWTLTSVTCNQQPMTINNNTVAIDVTNGDATCTFNNTYTPQIVRTITIQKNSGTPGYDAQVFFDGDLPDMNADGQGDFSTNGNGGLSTFQDLAPGVYNVNEIVPDGWTLSSVTCNQQPMTINNNTVAIDVTNGDATCTFNNVFVDSDSDGVSDTFDQCPGTPLGIPVDGVGCPIMVNVKFLNNIPCTVNFTFETHNVTLNFQASATFTVPAGTYTIPVTSSCTLPTTHTVTIVRNVDFTLVAIPTNGAAAATSLE